MGNHGSIEVHRETRNILISINVSSARRHDRVRLCCDQAVLDKRTGRTQSHKTLKWCWTQPKFMRSESY